MDKPFLPAPDSRVVITVGRQFGSGGREFGLRLATRYGLKYYDKELLSEAARRSGVAREFFEKSDERAPSFVDGLFSFAVGMNPLSYFQGSTAIGDDSIYRAQSDFIHQLAHQESCVIVGRTADYVLRDFPGAVNIFLHAPEDECVKRIMARHDCKKESEARSILRKTNKLRSEFYNFYTDRTWGDAATYDITFDSSRLGLEAIADIVVAYMEARKKQMAQ